MISSTSWFILYVSVFLYSFFQWFFVIILTVHLRLQIHLCLSLSCLYTFKVSLYTLLWVCYTSLYPRAPSEPRQQQSPVRLPQEPLLIFNRLPGPTNFKKPLAGLFPSPPPLLGARTLSCRRVITMNALGAIVLSSEEEERNPQWKGNKRKRIRRSERDECDSEAVEGWGLNPLPLVPRIRLK